MFGKNKVKEFEKGMEAGAKPFGEKLENIGKKIETSSEKLLNKVSDTVDTLIDIGEEHDVRIEDLENARDYQLKSFESIETLSDSEKKLFAGLIFTFAKQLQNKNNADSNELQKDYINNILTKLEITSPQQDITLDAISQIQASSKQLFLLSLFSEYAYLGVNSFSFLDDYEDLFENFRFNKKDIAKIQSAIEAEIKIRGIKGLVRKYEKPIDFQKKENSINQEVDALFVIDEEKKVFFDNNCFNPRFKVGKLLFDLGTKKLQIANNLLKPILDKNHSWILSYTNNFEKGDKIALLGAGIQNITDDPSVLWFIYSDEELKNNVILFENFKISPLINGMYTSIFNPSPVLKSPYGSPFKSNVIDDNNDLLNKFCNSLVLLCSNELKALNHIEQILISLNEKYINEPELIGSIGYNNSIDTVVCNFRDLVTLSLLTKGFINKNAEVIIKNTDMTSDWFI